MYNPLAKLSTDKLVELLSQGYLYFVRQSYPRGVAPGIKEAFLMTPYKTLEEANQHYIELKDDRRKFVYNTDHSTGDHLSRDYDRGNLYAAAGQPDGYAVYLNRLEFEDWYPPREVQQHLHHYVCHLGYNKPNAGINCRLGLKYGQLIVRFLDKKRGLLSEITLDELERY